MITREKFLIVFKKNCRKFLVSESDKKTAIYRLKDDRCPFPDVCLKETCNGCLVGFDSPPYKKCPISKEWQDQVFFYKAHFYNGHKRANSEMIQIVKDLKIPKRREK